MKKSTWLLLILFLGLGLTAYLTIGDKKDYNEGDQLAVSNTRIVNKVFLADRKGKRILLEKKDEGWIVNSKFPVRQGAIDLLLETLEKVRVKSFVAKAAQNNVVEELRTEGIKVEVYTGNDKLIKTLYVGGEEPGKRGTYMFQEGDNNLYVAHLKSWEGLLAPRFMLYEEDWRDKGVFRYELDEIAEVSVEYPGSPESSFQLENKGNEKFEIFPLIKGENIANAGKTPIKAKALYYLKGYESVIAEAFETNHPKRDSLVQTVPFSIINIKDVKGGNLNVKLYPVPGRLLGTLDDGTPHRAAVERYLASINENERFMLVQHLLFQRLLAPYSFFFEEE